MATVAGIAGLAVLVIAVVIEVVKDPPIVVWLELTPWGAEYKAKDAYKTDQVIDAFFTKLFKLDVFVNETHGLIEVSCHALTEENPVVVSLVVEDSREHLGEKDVVPGRSAVEGKGEVRKAADGWDLPRLPRKILIDRPWEIWKLKRDGKTQYTVIAKMNMDEDERYELTGETSGKTFPLPYVSNPTHASIDWYRKHRIDKDRMLYPADNVLTLVIQTHDAEGYVLEVRLSGDPGWQVPPQVIKRVSEGGKADTVVSFDLGPQGAGFKLKAEARLILPGEDEPDSWESQEIDVSPR